MVSHTHLSSNSPVLRIEITMSAMTPCTKTSFGVSVGSLRRRKWLTSQMESFEKWRNFRMHRDLVSYAKQRYYMHTISWNKFEFKAVTAHLLLRGVRRYRFTLGNWPAQVPFSPLGARVSLPGVNLLLSNLVIWWSCGAFRPRQSWR